MRRQIEKDLATVLNDTKFSFVKKGEVNIKDIYTSVKKRYPTLCDDNYWCMEHCYSGTNQPEWKHTVRTVMANLTKKHPEIVSTGKWGFWIFK